MLLCNDSISPGILTEVARCKNRQTHPLYRANRRGLTFHIKLIDSIYSLKSSLRNSIS
jgi:hypothetical protein